eukprot:98566-Chlamydomonas_euryale.AAC.13
MLGGNRRRDDGLYKVYLSVPCRMVVAERLAINIPLSQPSVPVTYDTSHHDVLIISLAGTIVE